MPGAGGELPLPAIAMPLPSRKCTSAKARLAIRGFVPNEP